MGKPARIKQVEIERAVKAVVKIGTGKVVLDHVTGRVEIVLGESAPAPTGDNWNDEDV